MNIVKLQDFSIKIDIFNWFLPSSIFPYSTSFHKIFKVTITEAKADRYGPN